LIKCAGEAQSGRGSRLGLEVWRGRFAAALVPQARASDLPSSSPWICWPISCGTAEV